jgi:ribonuclease BN (tRNA processing enzyme)
MKIHLLGAHNSEAQNLKSISLLIDGVLAIDAGALTSSLSLPAQQRLKAILLTHQHYDHIRDIPTLAMNLYLAEARINLYATAPVYDTLTNHLLNDVLYPKFLEHPPEKPTIKFTLIEPLKPQRISGYSVLAVKVNHSVPTVGYQITSPDGKMVLYTGDTGPGLNDCWAHVSPRLLITEISASDRYEDFAREAGHLTPGLLKQELINFRKLKGYLPRVVTVHMNPRLEKEIAAEIADVSGALDNPITLGYEGMQLDL